MFAVRVALLGLFVSATTIGACAAQPARPAPPAKYKVLLRYDIIAPRDEHVIQYDSLIEHLKSQAFEFDPPLEKRPRTDREDPTKNRMVGLVPSGKLLSLLRHPSVGALLVMPVDYKLPEDANQPVRVKLELASNLHPAAQKELANQSRVLLDGLGFREAVGYDHHGLQGRPYSRLVGTIPAGQVDNLLKDLRGNPGGWFAPAIALADLPTPLRNVSPILITEINPDAEPLNQPTIAAAREPAFLDKISDELWQIVQKKESQLATIRLQMILAATPANGDSSWQFLVGQAAPGFVVEGREGAIVTGVARVGQIANLAALPITTTIRGVVPAQPSVRADLKSVADNQAALEKSGLAGLHRRGIRGQGVRIAIVDSDFRGWQEQLKKTLPAKTQLVDLTREFNPTLEPLPFVGDAKAMGHGTHCAMAAALAAPDADFTLIRIQGAGPHELRYVVEYLRGMVQSPHLERRQDELRVMRSVLRLQREQLIRDRDEILGDFTDKQDLEFNFGFLGPMYGWIFDERDWLYQRMFWQEKEELELRDREERFLRYQASLLELKGIPIVSCALSWNTGYALGGGSALSHWLDDPCRLPLWFQSAGNARGQAWNDGYRDADDNGVMEFASTKTPLPKGRWTRELNFLAWQPYEEKPSLDLPAKMRLRIALQWLEPHDPDYFVRIGVDDLYRKPLAEMQLVLLHQRDPSGKTLPADDFQVVGRSMGLPQRLQNHPTHSIYEQMLEVTIDQPGRYALQVHKLLPTQWTLAIDSVTQRLVMTEVGGLTPTGLRPLGVPTLPGLEKSWELRPRLFVEAVDASRQRGRPIFADFASEAGAMPMPADAPGVLSVGAMDLQGRPQTYTPAGPPADMLLSHGPAVLTYDQLNLAGTGTVYGSNLATPFAAGWAATVLSSGRPIESLLHFMHTNRGKTLRVP